MNVTVAICTWNRAESLNNTLRQMLQMQIPDGINWELLVVNNNCSDHTDEVISRYTDHLPLKRLFTSMQGIAHARNCATEAAQGELLVFTDDDVLVDNNWLIAYVDAAQNFPEAAFFGGPIEPLFEGTPPRWLQKVLPDIDIAYAKFTCETENELFSNHHFPFGANMGFRTNLDKQYRFCGELGRVGKNMVHGEETALFAAMSRDGLIGRYIPAAKVRHIIPEERQNVEFLRRYYAGHGVLLRSQPQMQQATQLFGRPKWLYKAWLLSEINYYVSRVISPPETWIKHFKTAATWRGAFWNKA